MIDHLAELKADPLTRLWIQPARLENWDASRFNVNASNMYKFFTLMYGPQFAGRFASFQTANAFLFIKTKCEDPLQREALLILPDNKAILNKTDLPDFVTWKTDPTWGPVVLRFTHWFRAVTQDVDAVLEWIRLNSTNRPLGDDNVLRRGVMVEFP